ncbi:metallophosphoesterase [Halosimplex aquaticum]|uniref:Metallophosphoesterase n=1 Tax=Halosimplex aquaticum TaxID=3026162 RepID=A0ABD5Y3C6_9EURY|nr:metallophosphoesterase [Halosimplex aquaticum]
MGVEPLPGEPAAVAATADERLLVVADYHAGIEAGLRRDGVELPDHGPERRESLLALVDAERPDRLVVLGDLANAIGGPGRDEREEILALFDGLPADLPVTLVKGNHDGDVEGVLDRVDQSVEITPGHGVRIGEVGFAHGHTWPSPDVLAADVVCVAHEHPVVRLEDEVGGARVERVWLRGDLNPDPFREFHDADLDVDADVELVVFPAFNDLSGGTWVNVEGQDFLAPFLPDGLVDGEAYLLDGTRLGDYRRL